GSAAIQSGLRSRLSTERIAERAGAGSDGWSAAACRGKNKLRTERPFVHKTVAKHAHDACVVENAGAAAKTSLAIAKNVIRKAKTGSEARPVRIQSIFRHAGIAGNSVLPGE